MARERPEPIFNAPWPALLAAASILAPNAILMNADEPTILSLALVPRDFWAGHWTGVVTMMFVHGGWLHALMNAAFAVAFGAPVARLLGTSARGGAVFALFYMACGIGSGVGYAILHPDAMGPVVGASGAVSGLMGAAARTMDGRGGLGPMFGPQVLSLGLGWLVVNLVMAVAGGLLTGGAGGVAWEAHLIGFAVGVLVIGPFVRWAGPGDPAPRDPH
ncbi:rhomboid family intramembrane serine protease [Caulobacter segnis]|uniref:Rhomboid family protein n=2 Tax=Caulobacter segnis TaxID=88688 RepID=D5VIJ9_CAUST|nr:rhomboid family intramembrane serine protease [Caulobacter segnis]ADG09573.1 Rhomboid family protein [Caulobacter segnis ATCC 21756]AVQ01358.1 rhomboid family intramembrane serine protease [Caulobacter segnis]